MCLLALVYNSVRPVMLEAARRQDVDPDGIGFVDALRWLTHARPGEDLPASIVRRRRHRVEPRVRKRRPQHDPLMKRPRRELQQALLGK